MADKTGYIGRNPGDSSVKVARQTFTPTTATTDFTFASGYTVGYLDLFLNGAKLIEGTDYNANNGTTISMVADAQSGDVLEAVAYKAFNVGDSSSSSTGNFTVGNDLTVDNNATITNDLNVLGIGTVAKGFNVSAGGANIVGIVSATMGAVVTGVVTATSYKGDGSALTGIAATDTIAAASLTVSGITTLTGAVQAKSTTDSTTKDTGALIVEGGVGVEKNIVAGGDVRITGNINAGIATFTSVAGDGSALTGVAATDNIATDTLTVSGITTHYGDIQLQNGVGVGNSVTWDASAKSLLFKDYSYLKFGDGGDLSIHHDPATTPDTNRIIAASGQILELQTDKFRVVDNGASADLIAADDGGAATLFYSGSAKVATTLTGAKTTGVSSCTSHCMPTADVGGDLGSTTNRWANIYTADMQLSNEGSQNDIDGTWGKYTIQEGEDDLFLINRRTGKKYKFMLEEVQ